MWHRKNDNITFNQHTEQEFYTREHDVNTKQWTEDLNTQDDNQQNKWGLIRAHGN